MDRAEYMRQYRKKRATPAKSEKTLSNEAARPEVKAKKGKPTRLAIPETDTSWAIQKMGQHRRDEILKRMNKAERQ